MGRLHVCQTIIQIPRSLSNPIWFVSFHRVLDSSVTRIWDLVVPTKVLWRVPRSLKLCNYSLSKGATPEARCNTITGCVDLNGRGEVCAAFTRERGSSVLLHNYITAGIYINIFFPTTGSGEKIWSTKQKNLDMPKKAIKYLWGCIGGKKKWGSGEKNMIPGKIYTPANLRIWATKVTRVVGWHEAGAVGLE